LTESDKVNGTPYRLKANENKSISGFYSTRNGFVLEPEEALALIEKDSKNKDVIFHT
jgi:hypothetical protein